MQQNDGLAGGWKNPIPTAQWIAADSRKIGYLFEGTKDPRFAISPQKTNQMRRQHLECTDRVSSLQRPRKEEEEEEEEEEAAAAAEAEAEAEEKAGGRR